MPCNDSGFMDPAFSSLWGIVDFDWSNGKQDWANTKPMDCQERLLSQAKLVKALGTPTKVMVYRNLVKALPWYTDVRDKIINPAYSDWFLKFKDGVTGTDYHVPACTGKGTSDDPKKCSSFYHDQDQTPEHPHGDGSCTDACDCGEELPCGEYLWDHRNTSLRDWLIDEYVMGKANGVGNPFVDGVFLDDGWSNHSEPAASWWPKEGFCSADPNGGASEEMRNCTQDMGLGKSDVQQVYDAWRKTIVAVRDAIVKGGGYNYQMFDSTSTPATTDKCVPYMRFACPKANASKPAWQTNSALRYELTKTYKTKIDVLSQVTLDLATFLAVRGAYAWIGHGWIGCVSGSNTPANETQYMRPAAFDVDYGVPVGACHETAPKSGIFTRSWSKAEVTVDCNSMKGEIKMHT